MTGRALRTTVAGALLAAGCAGAAPIHVPADHATIQGALDAAAGGDTVLVQPGTYTETLTWPDVSSLKLLAAGDSSSTVVDGAGTGPVLFMAYSTAPLDSTTEIRGFTLRGGAGYTQGGAVHLNGASPWLRDLALLDNSAVQEGGGLYAVFSSAPRIEGCRIAGNSAGDNGGGISLRSNSFPTLIESVIEANTASSGAGGGLFGFSSCFPLLRSTRISGNGAAANGGGLHLASNSGLEMDSCRVAGNSAGGDGGGISLVSTNTSTISATEVVANSASRGGGLHLDGALTTTFTSLRSDSNTATAEGGGLHALGTNITVHGADVAHNTAYAGGGLHAGGTRDLLLNDCRILANRATTGDGGGIYAHSNLDLLINRSRIHWNRAEGRGGGFADVDAGVVELDSVLLRGNHAVLEGGASWSGDDAPLFRRVTVLDNRSDAGSGGLYADDSAMPSFDRLNIRGNGYGLAGGSAAVSAPDLWWGASSGPWHSSLNPDGGGDSTTAGVNPSPWLAAPDPDAPPVPPGSVQVDTVFAEELAISWTAARPPDFARLYARRSEAGGPEVETELDTATSWRLTGLTPGAQQRIIFVQEDTAGDASPPDTLLTAARLLAALDVAVTPGADSLHVTDGHPAFGFDHHDGAGLPPGSFRLQLSDDPSFPEPQLLDTTGLSSDSVTVPWTGPPLVEGDTYHLRIRLFDEAGQGGTWKAHAFRRNSVPPLPALVAPDSGAPVNGPLVLTCSQVVDEEGDPVQYGFEVFADSLLTQFAAGDTLADTSWTVAAELSENARYWWRAQAWDGHQYSAPSAPRPFVLDQSDEAPAPFALAGPDSGSLSPLDTVAVRWHPSADPDPGDTLSYRVQWSLDPTFASPQEATTTDTSLLLTDLADLLARGELDELPDDSTIHWRVRAEDNRGLATWSDPEHGWSFTVSVAEPPAPFATLAPEQGDSVSADTVDLLWGASLDPDPGDTVRYRAFLDTLADLSTAWPASDTLLDTSAALPGLEDDRLYHWHVLAWDEDGFQLSSDTSSFLVYRPEAPLPFALLAPEEGATIPDRRDFPLLFHWEAAQDPDPGDTLAYTLELSGDDAFSDPLLLAAGSADSLEVEELAAADWWWRVRATDEAGLEVLSSEVRSLHVTLSAGKPGPDLPESFAVPALYPNPFNPTLHCVVDLPEAAPLTVEVYNLNGRRVARLAAGQRPAGRHALRWDAAGHASGLYLLTARTPGWEARVHKVLLVR